MPRRPIRLTHPEPPCKWSFLLLHLHLHPHRPRNLLRLIPKQRNLKHWSHSVINPHGNRLRRLRPALRANILLRGYSNHQPILSHPLHWTNTSRMSLRRILSRQPHPNPILRTSLSPSLYHRRVNPSTSNIPTRNWIKQPPRNPFRLRQNSIPPILLHQRHSRICNNNHPTSRPSSILSQPSRRPRKFHTGQPSSHSPPHQT